MGDLISIVVPAYNNAPWLSRSLDSLLNQTYENLEIIVVDDGSTDDTGAVLERYTAKDSRIRAIVQKNSGVTAARIHGVEVSRGDWIGFMDADDEAEPEMYARLLQNARSSNADISHCGHQVAFPDGRISFVHNTGLFQTRNRTAALRELMDGGQVEPSLWTKLYRRELFSGLREKMDFTIRNNEDYLMNYYLFSMADISVYEDFCPYHYILRSGSASYRKLNEHMILDPIRVRERILASAPEELREAARVSLMRNCLFVYGMLSLTRENEYKPYVRQVRERVREQKPYFSLLSRRNRILSHMICTAPWSFDLAYRAYVRLFRREEQH